MVQREPIISLWVLQSGDAPELWNVSHSERVASLHRSFIDAGADIILTNSFGGSSYRLKLHQAQDRVAELNLAAASIARNEADRADRPVIVAGSLGPTGEILQPVGTLDSGAAEDAFAVQALALAEGGVDVIWLETMSSKEELQAAGVGAKQGRVASGCDHDIRFQWQHHDGVFSPGTG